MSAKTGNLVLWSARVCPWAQRATLALLETGLDHTIKEIDLQNKPSFYNEKINPASKVPVLQIGGENENDVDVPRIPESAVLLELISDLAQERGARSLTPADVIERAEARYFIERYIQLVQGGSAAVMYRGEAEKISDMMKGVEEFQSLLAKRLQASGGPFWHGKEPGIADIGIAPFLGRMKAFSSTIEPLKSSDFAATIFDKSGKYAIFAKYVEALMARDSWSKTFDEDYVVQHTQARIERIRAGQ